MLLIKRLTRTNLVYCGVKLERNTNSHIFYCNALTVYSLILELSCMSSIPARMKKIQLKMNALEFSQDFSHYKSMGIFPDAQGQLTPRSLSDLAEFRTRPRCYGCPCYLQK